MSNINYKRSIQYIFIPFFIALCGFATASAEGTSITFEIQNTKTLVIGKHLNGSIFIADSIKANADGLMLWQADSLIPQGLYEIVLPSKEHHPILVGEDRDFKVKINMPLSAQNIHIEGSDESATYIAYQSFIQNKMKEKKHLASQKKKYATNSDSTKQITQRQLELNEEVRNYILNKAEQFEGTLLASILKLSYTTPSPDFTQQAKASHNPDSTKQSLRFNYIFEHHFDNFDAADGRLLHTPFYKRHLDYFYNKVCPPVADSIISASIPLIEEAKRDSSTFQYMINYVMNYAEKSKVMGMDAVVHKLLESYYINSEVWWISPKQKQNAIEMEMYLRYNLIGLQAPNFTLPMWQNNQEPFSLYDMPSVPILLIFWEPDCGHCKTFIPKLYSHLSQKYSTLPFEVLAISTKADTALHNSFIEEHQLYDWLHLCNDNSNNDFKVYYDLRVVPKVYLLDENKKIIAKQLGIENLDLLIKEMF